MSNCKCVPEMKRQNGKCVFGCDDSPIQEELKQAEISLYIPYEFKQDGYSWTLIGVKNNFSKSKDTLEFAEYENQYGHIRKLRYNDHQ